MAGWLHPALHVCLFHGIERPPSERLGGVLPAVSAGHALVLRQYYCVGDVLLVNVPAGLWHWRSQVPAPCAETVLSSMTNWWVTALIDLAPSASNLGWKLSTPTRAQHI